jgi:hypothetical protein
LDVVEEDTGANGVDVVALIDDVSDETDAEASDADE